MKEYIIALYDPDDWDIFNDEMTSTYAHPFIPYRQVKCSDYLPISDKLAHYMLTEDEANKVAQDPRVESIELAPHERTDIELSTMEVQDATFTKSNALSFELKNWALLRCSSRTNPFLANQTINGRYNYNLTGEGVDIIISDTGVAEGHPELAVNPDGTGGSRVVDYDWTQLGVGVTPLSGGSGINGFLGDCRGHGSNCASIAAGNTNGWARDARIYSYRCVNNANNQNYDIVTGKFLQISTVQPFLVAKAFHLSKPIESNGYRRPTIMNCSWGWLTSYYLTPTGRTNWRGTLYPTATRNANYGQVYAIHGARYAAYEIAAAEAMAAGVIVVCAAGNNFHKIDVPGGIDYNNTYFSSDTTTVGTPYHQGMAPGAGSALVNGVEWKPICVGALDATLADQKVSFSDTGPRVDIYAPGTYIMGAGSKTYPYIDDPRNPIYKLSCPYGTSMASPQVAGLLACVAQARPWMNQIDARNWLANYAINGSIDEVAAGGTGYTNYAYLQGAPNKIMYMPYNSAVTMNTSGDIKIRQATVGSL